LLIPLLLARPASLVYSVASGKEFRTIEAVVRINVLHASPCTPKFNHSLLITPLPITPFLHPAMSLFDCLGLRPILHSKENSPSGTTNTGEVVDKNLNNPNVANFYLSNGIVLLRKASTDATTKHDEEGKVIIGRQQLLSALLTSCGCSFQHVNNNNPKSTQCIQTLPIDPHKKTATVLPSNSTKQCQTCQDTWCWASYALSRRMFLFQDKGTIMQIRGKHALVSVNDQPVLISSTQTGHANANDEWSQPPIHLQKNDVIRISPRSGKGCMEFILVPVQFVQAHEATKIDLDHLQTETSNQQKKDQKLEKNCRNSSPLNDTNQVSRNKESNTSSIRKSVTCQAANLTNEINETKQNQTGPLPPPKLFFVPSGHDFYEHRRQILQQKLENLGALFVPTVWDAQYNVISGSVRSLKVMAKHCNVLDSKLQRHLEQHKDVQCLLPLWADECISSNHLLLPPGRKHMWPHYRPNSSPKRRKHDDNNNINNNNNNNVNTNNNNVIDNDHQVTKKSKPTTTLSSSRKSFPHNVQCAEIFKQLSDLHQDMPLLDMDQWKSYCFRIVSGRLLHLDFEVDTDPATLRRLRGVKGFGKSVVDKIQEILNTGTVSRLQEFQNDPNRVAMKNFTDIWGVGRVKAKDLMALGYKDIYDIRKGLKSNNEISKMQLDRNQLVGVDCYEDIRSRMGRGEVETIKDAVKKAAQRVFPGIEVTIQGSYRRRKRTCGDVDIHLTHRSFHEEIPDHGLGRIIGECQLIRSLL
jgi:hypothetical protein